jgi:hypothetical protein
MDMLCTIMVVAVQVEGWRALLVILVAHGKHADVTNYISTGYRLVWWVEGKRPSKRPGSVRYRFISTIHRLKSGNLFGREWNLATRRN